MTWAQPDLEGLEALLADLVDPAVEPRPAECLAHYLDRMLRDHGCGGDHRYLRRWAQRRARSDVASLLGWARGTGGCCCDCEVVLNSLLKRSTRRRAGVMCGAVLGWQDGRRSAWEGPDDPLPRSCSGVGGSAPPSGVHDLNPYD